MTREEVSFLAQRTTFLHLKSVSSNSGPARGDLSPRSFRLPIVTNRFRLLSCACGSCHNQPQKYLYFSNIRSNLSKIIKTN